MVLNSSLWKVLIEIEEGVEVSNARVEYEAAWDAFLPIISAQNKSAVAVILTFAKLHLNFHTNCLCLILYEVPGGLSTRSWQKFCGSGMWAGIELVSCFDGRGAPAIILISNGSILNY